MKKLLFDQKQPTQTILIILILSIVTNISIAGIYKWTDENGVIHYSENKPVEIKVEEFQLRSYSSVTIEANTNSIESKPSGKTKKTSLKRPKKVVMYSAEWCGVCKQAKKYFRKNRIRFTSYDVEKNESAKRRFKKMGAKGVPVILVGKQRMNGFSAAGFNQIYNN